MGERRTYHSRRHTAMSNPQDTVSLIVDGMACEHSEIPWFGNGYSAKTKLPQKIQSVLNHGREYLAFRIFHNVKGGANIALHCLLLALERVYIAQHRVPIKNLSAQIDGGSENSNNLWIGIFELLVEKGLVDHICLTRLLVGHTHEDVDGIHGNIWIKGRKRV